MIFSKTKKKSSLNDLFNAIHRIANMGVAKAKKKENEGAKEILKGIENLISRFLLLKVTNPKKFEQIYQEEIFYEDTLELEISQKLIKETTHSFSKESQEKTKPDLDFGNAIREENVISGLLRAFEKIWEAAVEAKNEDISRNVIYKIEKILIEISYKEGYSDLVIHILNFLSKLTFKLISNTPHQQYDASIYPAAINWYRNIVFSRLSRPQGIFQLIYLPIFNRTFFENSKLIIKTGSWDLFKALFSKLSEGVYIGNFTHGALTEYSHLLLQADQQQYSVLEESINEKYKELNIIQSNIFSQESFNEWSSHFLGLKSIINPYLTGSFKNKATNLEKELRESVAEQFKYDQLLKLVFGIGTYCIFKEKHKHIKYMWEYNQPPDSDASWVGDDVISNTIPGLIKLYFGDPSHSFEYEFWDDHHGSRIYYKKYFLLLLFKIFLKNQSNQDDIAEIVSSLNLREYKTFSLRGIESSLDELLTISKNFPQDQKLLKDLGFKENDIKKYFEVFIPSWIEKVKSEINDLLGKLERETAISRNRIEEFKKEFLDSFKKAATIKQIYKHYNNYVDKTEEPINDDLPRFGLSNVDHKAVFFDEWFVSYSGWGQEYGVNLGSSENKEVIHSLVSLCKKIEEKDFDRILMQAKINKPIIISINVFLHDFFRDREKLNFKWNQNHSLSSISAFEGACHLNGKNIPVLQYYLRSMGKFILILNEEKMGKLIQKSPISPDEPTSLITEEFFIKIQAYTENDELINELVAKPPKWLKEKGDDINMRKYLDDKALIQIFERFNFNPDDNFEGYIINID
jgi:hypothetical protein